MIGNQTIFYLSPITSLKQPAILCEKMKNTNKKQEDYLNPSSPFRFSLILAVSIFLAEALVMGMIHFALPQKLSPLALLLLDSTLLLFLVLPPLYLFSFRPILTYAKRVKEEEGKLMESESRASAIMQSANDAIITANSSGKIVFWNQAAKNMFGYAEEEILGKPLTMLIPERHREAHEIGLERAASGGEFHLVGKTVEVEGMRKNGSKFPLSLSLSSWLLREERFFSAILQDISERKERENALKKTNEQLKATLDKLGQAQELLVRSEKLASLGTLSAGVAHEILNPLNIINGLVQMMKRKTPAPEDLKKNLEEIMRQVSRTAKITDNLRAFARKREGEVKPVDLHALFENTLTLLEHHLNLENIQVEKLYNKDLPLIKADEDQLSQVFLNLLNNAKDAMQGGARNAIILQTKVLKDEIEIRFSDTGPGIPKEFLGKIFDPFFTTKVPGKGTGLGLSITNTIIENHEGTLRVESAEGKGTTFVITLPVGAVTSKQ